MVFKVSLIVEVKEAGLMDFIKRAILIGIVGKSTLENELVKVSVDKIEKV